MVCVWRRLICCSSSCSGEKIGAMQAEQHAVLDAALEQAEGGVTQLILLFPSPGAVSITHVAAERAAALRSARPYTLLLLDGTWQFANEMFRAFRERLLPPQGSATLTCLAPQAPRDQRHGAQASAAPPDGKSGVSNTPATPLDESEPKATDAAPQAVEQPGSGPLLLRTEPLVRQHALLGRSCD